MQVKSKPTKREEAAKSVRVSLLDNARRGLRDTRSELRKVTWPTREQVTRMTTVVAAASLAMGVFLGLVDYIFETILKMLAGG
jgi:preprotein translocase subunit SecE